MNYILLKILFAHFEPLTTVAAFIFDYIWSYSVIIC